MIFGFNTDIKQGESTYHVQSEVRAAEQLLQTQIFVQGRCIVKRAVSYAERTKDPAFTDEVKHEALRQQHRWVVEAIRDGYLEELVKGAEQQPKSEEVKAEEKPEEKLDLRFLSSARPSPSLIVIRFEVSVNGSPVQGASVQARVIGSDFDHSSSQNTAPVSGISDDKGMVELKLPVPAGAHGEANLVVEATHATLNTSKKFRLKAAPNR